MNRPDASNPPPAASATPAAPSGHECPICFESYDEAQRLPKLLGCGHTFCLSCLSSLVPAAAARQVPSIVCPYCSKETQLNDARTVYALISGAAPKPAAAPLPRPASAPPQGIQCATHKRPLELYCISCDLLICNLCWPDFHQAPPHSNLSVQSAITAAAAQVEKTRQLLAGFGASRVQQLQASLQSVDAVTAVVTAEGQRVESELQAAFERMQQALATRCLELKRESQAITADKLRRLNEQRNVLTSSFSAIQSAVTASPSILNSGDPIAILRMRQELVQQLKKLDADTAWQTVQATSGLRVVGAADPEVLRCRQVLGVAAQATPIAYASPAHYGSPVPQVPPPTGF